MRIVHLLAVVGTAAALGLAVDAAGPCLAHPDDFAALMDKLERVLDAAGAQVRRSGTPVPGLDYSVIGNTENAAGS
jgi:hypothetical protein